MFFSQFICNRLLTASGYQRKRVGLRCVSPRRGDSVRSLPRGAVKGLVVKSVLFGVPGLRRLGMVFVCVTAFMMLTKPSSAEDRTISMYNIHTEETITVTFKRDGQYIPEALQQLNHFMRDWRQNLEIKIDAALIDLMWELHEELGSKEPIHLICGYRSPKTNEMLRRTSGGQAKNSLHLVGKAADLVFPDVPLKQVRYAALAKERGGVGYYPTSGLPFVHVDTGNVRHWPSIGRVELAAIFPKGHSQHVPDDGRPLSPSDYRMALAKYQSNGTEMPWVVTHKHVDVPMLASLSPKEKPLLQRASLTLPSEDEPAKPHLAAAAPLPEPESVSKPESLSRDMVKQLEAALPDNDEEEDEMEAQLLPANLLFSDMPLAYLEMPDPRPHPGVFRKIGALMSPPSVLASEQFDRGLQVEELYEVNMFKGPAVAFIRQRRMTVAASIAARAEATR